MRTGDVIDSRYLLMEECGSGSSGVVWHAFDRKLKRDVALKRPHAVLDETARDRFHREAELMAQLHHPHIVGVYDTVDSADGCWLVMEYLPSRGLDRILAVDGPLRPQLVARIGVQVAMALQAAHAVGIVHRDVKPGNVLVTDDGVAKLADFGISVYRDLTLTDEGRISGTAAYIAPEVADGHAATAASDVFSLGATLFAAVEGTPPYGNDDAPAVLARARKGTIAAMNHAGPLQPILADLLARRPGRRPTAAEVHARIGELVGDWTLPQWLADSPRPSDDSAKPSRTDTARWLRRSYRWAAAAVVVLVGTAVYLTAARPWQATTALGHGTTTTPAATAAPGPPASVRANAESGAVTVSWDAAAGNGAAVTSYLITWTGDINDSGTRTVDENTHSATVDGLTNGQTYTFSVSARNDAGSGPAVTAPPVTPLAMTSVSAGHTAANSPATNTGQTPSGTTGTPSAGAPPARGPAITIRRGTPYCQDHSDEPTCAQMHITVTGFQPDTEYTFYPHSSDPDYHADGAHRQTDGQGNLVFDDFQYYHVGDSVWVTAQTGGRAITSNHLTWQPS